MSPSMPAPVEQQGAAVSADGTKIAYRTIGAGPGVIVVGGALRTSEDYLPLARALADLSTMHSFRGEAEKSRDVPWDAHRAVFKLHQKYRVPAGTAPRSGRSNSTGRSPTRLA